MKKTQNGFAGLTSLLIVIGLVVVVAVGVLVYHHQHKSTVALNCTPMNVQSLDPAQAISEYKTFVSAIKQKNQPCADQLSSSYFKQWQAQVFPGSNGQWITKKEGKAASVADRLASFPTQAITRNFVVSSYASSDAHQTTGNTVSYPFTDPTSKVKMNLQISFVVEQNQLLVDYLEMVPIAIAQ
ncbi:MAG TPA: hypothetical protein VG992_00790 [Candidatus Saccharimonadales bacterium]|nr:hypothetical protein [Candidatus Saccharimonadales bacterium]